MIQELLGGATLIAGERKPSINGGSSGGVLLPTTPPLSSLSSSTTNFTTTSTTTTTIAATTATVTSSAAENLRCPRCDSSNTKFCYYNNYNLTQPRHFCKTCRRYWTKGGALRNVPIGGGCRKNKNIGVSNSMAKPTSTKMKTIASELGKTSNFGPRGFEVEHEPPPLGPILWGSPQNTHILDLLRAGQNQNPNPNPSPLSINVKEEGNLLMGHMVSSEPLVSNALLNHRTFGYDAIAQVPSLGLCSSFWRNNQDHQPQQQNGGFVLGDHHNSGIQELYHKLRSSSVNNYCNNDNSSQVFMGNLASNYSSSSSISNNILEPTSVAAGELGYWNNNNPTFSWSDLSTANGTAGAYP